MDIRVRTALTLSRIQWGQCLSTGLLALVLLISATSCSRSPASSVQTGNRLFAQGKYQEAALRYRKAIQTDSNFGDAYFRLGLANIKLHQGQEAFYNLKRAVDLLPANQEVKRQLAEFCLVAYLGDPAHRGKLYEQAKTLDDQMLAANPKSADALRLQGYLALVDKKPDAAIELLRRASEQDPNDPSAPLSLADALMRNGHEAEGEQLVRDLIRRKPNYGPAYDLLCQRYLATGRKADAENLLKERIQANPKESLAAIELAGLYQSRGDTAAAEACLKTLTDRIKDFPEAYLYAGNFHVAANNVAAAEKDYQRGMEVDPAHRASYLRKIATLRRSQGRIEETQRDLEEVLKLDPNDQNSKAGLAGLLMHSKETTDRERAIVLAQELVQQNPNNSELHMTLGRAYALHNQAEQARREFQEAARRSPRAVAPFIALAELSLSQKDFNGVLRYAEAGLNRQVGEPKLRFLRAQGLRESGQYAQARYELNLLAQGYPKSMDTQVEIGLLDVAEKKYREAEDHFQKLSKTDPSDLRPIRGLVQTYTAGGKTERAFQVVQEAVKKSPDNLELAYLLVSTASAAGQPELAEQRLTELVAKFPNEIELRIQLAQIQSGRGELQRVYETLAKVRELKPQYPGIDALVAAAEESLGHTADAQADYRKALAKDPENTFLMNNLAFSLSETGGNLDEAIQLAQKGLHKQPEDAHLTDTLACIYVKKNQAQIAAPMLEKLTQKYPDNVAYHYHFGLALLGKGNKAQARSELETALHMHPTQSQQKQIHQALQQAG